MNLNAAEQVKRWQKWESIVSFQATNLPAKEALKKLLSLIGETDFAMPDKLTGTVTIDVRNKKFNDIFQQVQQQIKPMVFPEMRQKLTLKAFGAPN